MTYLGVVDVVVEYGATVSSPSVVWRLPAVIRLRRVAPYVRAGVKFSPGNVKARDGYCCQYCGKRFRSTELTMDHVIPRSQGGLRTFENIVAACGPCNHRKADLSCDEAGMFPVRQPATPRALPVTRAPRAGTPIPEEWVPFLA